MVFSDVMSQEMNKSSRDTLMVPDDTAGSGRCLMVCRTFKARKWLNYSALREPSVFSSICQLVFAFLPLVFR